MCGLATVPLAQESCVRLPRIAWTGPWYAVYPLATGWAVAAALVLFVLVTRRERRDRDLLARLDAAVVG